MQIFRPVDGAHSSRTRCYSCYSDFSLCLSWVISLALSSSSLILFSAVSLLLMSLWKARFISVSDFLSHWIFFYSFHLFAEIQPLDLAPYSSGSTKDMLHAVIFFIFLV